MVSRETREDELANPFIVVELTLFLDSSGLTFAISKFNRPIKKP